VFKLVVCSGEVNALLEDNLAEVADAIVKEFDEGKLTEAINGGHDGWQAWIKGIGKAMKRKVHIFNPCHPSI
jgi:glutamyl-tRNA synthetase